MRGVDTTVPIGAAAGQDWLEAASPAERAEYAEFGPWILRMTVASDIPRAFLPWAEVLLQAEYVFKVPKSVDRRVARPGTDLYQAIYSFGSSGITLLTLADGVVTERVVSMSDIQAIANRTNLLQSELAVYLSDGTTCTMPYNTVSCDEIEVVMAFIKREITSSAGAETGQSGYLFRLSPPGHSIDDPFYKNQFYRVCARTAEVGVVLWDAPQAVGVGPWWNRRFRLGCLVLKEPNALTILSRGKFWRKRSEAIYMRSEIHVPVHALAAVEFPTGAHEKADGLTLKLMLTGHAFEINFSRGAFHDLMC